MKVVDDEWWFTIGEVRVGNKEVVGGGGGRLTVVFLGGFPPVFIFVLIPLGD